MAWVHNLDPFAIQFTEHFGIRWYGLAYLAGFVAGWYAMVLFTKRGGTQFKVDQVADYITYLAIGVLVGGRLGYAVFYAPELFTTFDGAFPYWGLLKVNEGGMASHGGILGVMCVSWAYARYHKMSALHCLDLTVFGGSLGFMFGRLANFVNGELYGRQAPDSLAWAVKFPQEMVLWFPREMDRLRALSPAVEALGEMKTPQGEVVALNASVWSGWLDAARDFGARERIHETIEAIMVAVQNGNVRVTELLAPALTTRHPSQLYQAVLEGLLVFVLLCVVWLKPRKPGVLAGWFGILYCGARIIGEQYRMPDAHIGFQLFGLTRGQWISIGVFLVGLAMLLICARRNVPKMGGWFREGPLDPSLATAGEAPLVQKGKKKK